MGKYPIISISLKEIDADSYEKARAQLIKTFEFVFAEDGQRTRYLCAEITERKFLSWNSAWNLKL